MLQPLEKKFIDDVEPIYCYCELPVCTTCIASYSVNILDNESFSVLCSSLLIYHWTLCVFYVVDSIIENVY